MLPGKEAVWIAANIIRAITASLDPDELNQVVTEVRAALDLKSVVVENRSPFEQRLN